MANVLLVDDDVVFLDSLKQGLESIDHTVFPATTTQKALSVLKSSDVDITICDTIMAGGGALSLLHDMQVQFPDVRLSS